ncbi:MAG: 3-dehydroquinate synthase [Halanaerobiales bacterium]
MKDLNINIESKSIDYNIIFTENIVDKLKVKVKDYKALLITDRNVDELYTQNLFKLFKEENDKTFKYVLNPGEAAKNIENLRVIYELLLDNDFNRDDFIISIGGGVVGDIAGLASSTYKRGINFMQVPTTLLSQVDSSIGGKTAVNFREVKNVIGTFYNPKSVLINTDYLETLSKREYLNGFAELIKTSLIGSEDLFKILTEYNYSLRRRNKELLKKVIEKSILFKREVVKKDLYDQNKRKILNFGHTIGHIIEANNKLNYKHGEAVALGISFASLFSVYKNLLNRKEYDKIIEEIEKYNLPTKTDQDISFIEINSKIRQDKKISDNKINMVLLNGLFNPILKSVSLKELKEVWSDFIEKDSGN